MVPSSPLVSAALHPGRDQTSADTAAWAELPLSPAIPVAEGSPLAALDRWLRSAILGLLLCAWLCTEGPAAVVE